MNQIKIRQQMPPTLKKRKWKLTGRNTDLLLLSLPVVLYVFVFQYLPMIGVVLAFKDYNYADGILFSPWVGFDNFIFFFKSDMALRVTLHSVLYNLCFIVPGTVLFALVAIILNEIRNTAAIKFYQTIMFFPYFLSWTVVAFALYTFLSPAYGILNQIMDILGMEGRNWFIDPEPWPWIIITAGLWKSMGMSVLIYYAVLVGIDKSYYEAADIDGAGKLQKIWHISVPSLIPVTTIQLILSVGRIFNSDFGLFYQLTQGSNMISKTTEVIDTYVFKLLMNSNDVGMGTAVGVYQSVVGVVLVLVTNYIVGKMDPDYTLI